MPVNFNFDDDLDATPAIIKNASIVNGGERVDSVACFKCDGSGTTRWGRCFRCNGNGQISKRSAAASKGVQTAKANLAEKKEQTYASPEWAYITKRISKGSTFYVSLADKVAIYGSLTERQLEIVRTDIIKDEAFYAARKAERLAAAPVIPTAAIQALFDKASAKIARTPIFRTVDITISKAPMSGKNPGALYVKTTDGDEYCGKIVDGRFHKAFNATDVTDALRRVAENPTAEAIAYGRKFGACGCCGKTLVDPVSVAAKVGPVCAENWGLEGLRDAARQLLAIEQAAEQGGAA